MLTISSFKQPLQRPSLALTKQKTSNTMSAREVTLGMDDSHSSSGANSSTRSGGGDDMRAAATTRARSTEVVDSKGATIAKGARAVVMLVLMLSAATVASLAYKQLAASEHDVFKTQFENSAEQILHMAKKNAANVFESFEALANLYPFYAQQTNETLPFVTIQDFESIAANVRRITKAAGISYSPFLYNQDDLDAWAAYSARNGAGWIANGRAYLNDTSGQAKAPEAWEGGASSHGTNATVASAAAAAEPPLFLPFVFAFDPVALKPIPLFGDGLRAPLWQLSPVPSFTMTINVDTASDPTIGEGIEHMRKTGYPSLTKPLGAKETFGLAIEGSASTLLQPVFDGVVRQATNRRVVGYVSAVLAWKIFFDDILPPDRVGIEVVIQSCDTYNTFRINGPEAEFKGEGDQHETKYTDMGQDGAFISIGSGQESSSGGQICKHSVRIYPTALLEDAYKTSKPIVYSIVIVAIFAFAASVFHLYAVYVAMRQDRTELRADKSSAIVAELFPGEIAAQLYGGKPKAIDNSNVALNSSNHENEDQLQNASIADLYTETTVLFADIAGFTAWSSTRDPHQVFKLLESIFQAFDAIANKLGVFKVETIGDCYVAVCGVPKPNKDHAVIMCNFARSAIVRFRTICRKLELKLGPDTADLALRVGMHSGPVTAGVLRGERARFQLFGDTVNTASRIESTGQRDRVHMSEQTAAELVKHGKESWMTRREDNVTAKGKGHLVTYWLKLKSAPDSPPSIAPSTSNGSSESDDCDAVLQPNESELEPTTLDSDARRYQRLVHWNSEVLLVLLRQIVTNRIGLPQGSSITPHELVKKARQMGLGTSMVVEEVMETIDMPEFVNHQKAKAVELDSEVESQLRTFVTSIAAMYKSNPFHNFEHASHVAMSVSKLLGRIVAAPPVDGGTSGPHSAAVLHKYTCGIASDPLTQFAVVLSALIHDIDHPGVANGQLIKEDPILAARYQNKSVAEQNSIDLAWQELMSPRYGDLCASIFATKQELHRFRSLLVNSIIATDIFDKEQGTLRTNRWNKAFQTESSDDGSREAQSRKATIFIEHLIQASDVAHTMQHWHVYQKWNQRLFDEMMTAYRAGRSEKDPSIGWFAGELWFFDNYAIPLANKLKECGVFGVSSDEYLTYALQNRCEWKAKGAEIVQTFLCEYNEKHSVVETSVPLSPSYRFTV